MTRTRLSVHIAACSFGALLIAGAFLHPHIEYADNTLQTETAKPNSVVEFSGDLVVPWNLVTHYRIIPGDCLLDLTINDTTVPLEKGFCSFSENGISDRGADRTSKIFWARVRTGGVLRGRALDLREYLHAGSNAIRAHVQSTSGLASLRIDEATLDPWVLTWILTSSLALAWTLHDVLRRSIGASLAFFPTLLATVLRIGYFVATPYVVRGYDINGHIRYAEYLIQHHALPDAAASWEWFQPPLYYLFLASLYVDGISNALQMRIFQAVALLASFGTYALCAYIAHRVIPEQMRRMRTLALTLVAALPGIVYFAARINNDVLCQLLTFAVLALLVHAMRRPHEKLWIITSVVLGLAILTKGNALVLVPVLGGTLYLGRGSVVEKKQWLSVIIIALMMTVGWYYVYKLWAPTGFIGNSQSLPSELNIGRNWRNLTAFSPGRILMTPFNNPWFDDAGRQYFPEYFFRSAFFGEYAYSSSLIPLARGIMALALLCIPVFLYGCACGIRRMKPEYIPLFLTLVFGFAMHAAFRIAYPFASSQDFRYSTILAIPAVIFLAIGISAIRWRSVRIAVESCAWALGGLMSLFLMMIILG